MGLKAWRDSLFLFRKDLRSDGLYLIWNVVFMIYLGGSIGVLNFADARTDTPVLSTLLDFAMLTLSPMICFQFSRRSFRYLRDDSYTQMLVYYRTLPIPLEVVIRNRVIQSVCSMILNGTVFFLVVYFLSDVHRENLTIWQYISYALSWGGYGLIFTGPYIYFEFLRKGKAYLVMSFVIMLFTLGLAILINLAGWNIANYSLDSAKSYGLLSPVMWVTLLVGAISLFFTSRLVERKLSVRNLV